MPNPEPLADDSTSRPARSGRGRRWLTRLVLLVVVAVAVHTVVRHRHELAQGLRTLDAWALAASLVPAVAAGFAGLLTWRVLMAELGAPLPLRAAARIFFLSQLGKYLPGPIWSVLGQMELGRAYRVPRRVSVTVGVLVLAVSVTGGVSLAVLLLPFAGPDALHRYWWAALLLPACYAALHPPVLGRALAFGLRLARREPLAALPSWPGLRRALVLQVVVWLLLGLQVWFLLVGLDAPPGRALAAAIGGYALAYSLGMLAVVVPAGAGVREAVLVVCLAGVVSVPEALLVALITRTVATVCDIGLALTQLRRAPVPSAD